jgi:hypothetical protein
VLWRAASFMLYSFVRVGISPSSLSNHSLIKSADAEGILVYGVGESAAACRERRQVGICSRNLLLNLPRLGLLPKKNGLGCLPMARVVVLFGPV